MRLAFFNAGFATPEFSTEELKTSPSISSVEIKN